MKVDYYALLSHAVAGLERDSYAARGAIYDREHKALMRRLFSADPPHTDVEIEREQRAFREAIRRIEFGVEEMDIPLAPEREIPQQDSQPAAEASASVAHLPPLQGDSFHGPSPWPRTRSTRRSIARQTTFSRATADTPSDPPRAAVDPTAAAVALLKRRPIAGRVFGRALIAIVVLGLGATAYDALTGEIGLPFLQNVAATRGTIQDTAAPPPTPIESASTGPQQVILFDGNRPDPSATKFAGSGSWRLRSEAGPSQQDPGTVVVLDLSVPGRKIALTMTMRREPPTSAMSHLLEFRFLREDKTPDPDITNIASVIMTTAEMTLPTVLIGQVVSVAPGVFLFGLSAEASAREKNLRSLQELPWLGVPVAYRNGAARLLLVEKGVDGEHVIKEALRRWGP